ncbi:MAG: hypothetical protein ACREUB_09530 [Burkholderiales bacterium]
MSILGFCAAPSPRRQKGAIVPQDEQAGREGSATAMLFTGFLAMMYLDFTLG